MAEHDTDDVQYEEYQESWTGRIVVAAVVALALIAGAFFAGKAMAGGGGPATLAEAVEQAQAGDLPCGESATPAAASPAATPGANASGPQGGADFLVRGICDRGQGQGQNGQPQGRGRLGGFGQTGQVTAVNGDSLTLQGPTGDTTVKLDNSTTISKSAKGAVADIKTGDSVLVSGTGPNSQNAATSVTILPQAGGS